MKNSDLKIIAVILSIALVFTVIASSAVSVASIVFLAKNNITATSAGEQTQQGTATSDGSSATTPDGSTGGSSTGDTASTGDASSTGDTASTGGTASTGDTASTGGSTSTGGTASTGGSGSSGSSTTASWDKAKTFNFYKEAAHKVATTGMAGYDKIEWQELKDLKVGSIGSVVQPFIDKFMTTKEEAEVKVNAKGSDEAKRRFPDCTLTDLSKVVKAEKKDLANGNYEITIIMADEDTPMNKQSSFLAQVTNSVLFWEDIEETIKNDVPIVSAINSRSVNYKGYRITAEMTKDGKFVKLGHYATVYITANAKITVVTLDVGGTLYNNCEYSNFKY